MKKLELDQMQITEGGQHLPNPIEEAYCEFAIATYLTTPFPLNVAYLADYLWCIESGY